MAKIERVGFAPVTPLVAQRVWTDTTRWPAFVDGFGHVVGEDVGWPNPGATVVWQSGPAGRGRVSERVERNEDGVFTTRTRDEQMTALQTVRFAPSADGSHVRLELDYELTSGGPLRALTDVLFIRRALAMALERTLARFSTEAADEAVL